MAQDRSQKRKRPWTRDELLKEEDRLARFLQNFREVRQKMEQFGVDVLELKLGTLQYRMGELEDNVQAIIGEANKQIGKIKREREKHAVIHAAATREVTKARKPRK